MIAHANCNITRIRAQSKAHITVHAKEFQLFGTVIAHTYLGKFRHASSVNSMYNVLSAFRWFHNSSKLCTIAYGDI